MTQHCRVLIIGAGPAGMFAARELALHGIDNVKVIDSGHQASNRDCPLTESCNCTPCDVLEGLGGSGGVSDGKMTFALDRGTQMEPIFREEHLPLLSYVDSFMSQMGITGVRYEPEDALFPDSSDGIEFQTYPLWHVGSDGIRLFSSRFTDYLEKLDITISRRTRAQHLIVHDGEIRGVVVRRDYGRGEYRQEEIYADHVVLAVGLFGIGWLEEQMHALGVRFDTGPAGIGLRIETPAEVLAPLFDSFYDWKAVGTFEGITLRSFCCNRNGYIMPEYHRSLQIRNVNGHSYLDPARRSESSNFSLQAKITTDDVDNPQQYVRNIARKMNNLSGGWQVRQTIARFLDEPVDPDESMVTYPQARRADLRTALPPVLKSAFSEYLRRLDNRIPGIVASGWLYGPEIKYHARKLPVERDTWRMNGMQSTYVIGDSTGLTGSYVSAALTGIIAARAIFDSEEH